MDDAIRIIQITDPHILIHAHSKDTTPLAILDIILSHISQLVNPPDMMVLTSEILRQHRNETVHRLQQTNIPFQWVAHQKNIVLNVKDTHFIMLNSLSAEFDYGLLGNDTLAFLENDLEESWAHPCVVTLRHHPLAIRTLSIPGNMLNDATKFLHIIDRFYHVKAVLFGHIHHDFMLERNNIWFLASPAVCPITQQNPDVVFQYRIIDLTQDGEIETSLQEVGIF